MNHPRTIAVLIATLAAGLVLGCGPLHIGSHVRPGRDLIVLLPDPGDGTIGRAVVSSATGTAELAAARASILVSPNQGPVPVTVMSEGDVRRLFGDALSALPPAPQHFILYFRFESDELTDESRALVPQILQAVKNRPSPDVAVVGHTDTTGTAAGNVELGLRRANAIRSLLVDVGVGAAVIEVTSHGETDLLVKTADDVLEPRNRRVDISVR
jgi:outer membrane protein OmpA-like peptidoglycan-associated protein